MVRGLRFRGEYRNLGSRRLGVRGIVRLMWPWTSGLFSPGSETTGNAIVVGRQQ